MDENTNSALFDLVENLTSDDEEDDDIQIIDKIEVTEESHNDGLTDAEKSKGCRDIDDNIQNDEVRVEFLKFDESKALYFL